MNSEELKQRRLALNMTQAQLAVKLGVSATAVAHWEQGHRSPDSPEMLSMAISWLEYQQPKSERHKKLMAQLNQSITESRERINADATRQRVRKAA